MRTKLSLYISAALTGFVLVMLVGVAIGMSKPQKSEEQVSASLPTQPEPTQPALLQPVQTQMVAIPLVEAPAAITPAAMMTPAEAALLAARITGEQDISTVDPVSVNGVNTYKVTFASGEVVYLDLNGQVVSISLPQASSVVSNPPIQPTPTVVIPLPNTTVLDVSKPAKKVNNGGGYVNPSSGEDGDGEGGEGGD